MKAVALFFKRLVISVFWMLLLFLAGWCSYKATYYYCQKQGGTAGESQGIADSSMSTGNNGPSALRNVIYGVDDTTGRIGEIVLEISGRDLEKIFYITIPGDTDFEISAELYRKFSAIHQDVPKVIRMENLKDYFKGNEAYEYGDAILGDVMGIEITRHTGLKQDEFFSYFKKNKQGIFVFAEKKPEKWLRPVSEDMVIFELLPGTDEAEGAWQGKEDLHSLLGIGM